MEGSQGFERIKIKRSLSPQVSLTICWSMVTMWLSGVHANACTKILTDRLAVQIELPAQAHQTIHRFMSKSLSVAKDPMVSCYYGYVVVIHITLWSAIEHRFNSLFDEFLAC